MTITTIRITGKELRKHYDWDEDLWCTAGSDMVYWASQPSWADDKVVATVWDFLDASGYDELEGLEEYEFELEVELP